MEQGDFRQGTVEPQARDVEVSVTVGPLVISRTGLCEAVIVGLFIYFFIK